MVSKCGNHRVFRAISTSLLRNVRDLRDEGHGDDLKLSLGFCA